MTPREPDRFDKQALDIIAAWNRSGGVGLGAAIAAALRAAAFAPLGDNHHNAAACPHCGDLLSKAKIAAESSALERAAQVVEEAHQMWRLRDIAQQIRALIPPAAAPAVDYDPITAPVPEGDMNGPHGPLPAAETGKAQEAEAIPDPWGLLAQARDWLDFMVKHPGDGVPLNLIARIDAKLAARAAPPEREGK